MTSNLIPFPLEPEIQDPQDLTPFVERIEKLEDLCGVRIGGISAYYEGQNASGTHGVKLMAEVTGLAGIGHMLDANVVVECAAYDASRRVVAIGRETLWRHDFRGMQALTFNLFSPVKPERFALFPRR